MKDINLQEYLAKLSVASGNEVIEMASDFQCGSLSIEGLSIGDFLDDDDEDDEDE